MIGFPKKKSRSGLPFVIIENMKIIILILSLLAPLLFFVSCAKEEGDSLTITSSLRGQVVEEVDLVCKEGETCPWTEALAAVELEPVPSGAMCTRIYGGPEEIELSGQVGGQEISAQFNRSGGCEITRFDSLAPFLRAAGIEEESLFPRAVL